MEELKRKDAIILNMKTKLQLASEYNVSRNTMAGMCKNIGITHRKTLNVNEVRKIYVHYGVPGIFEAI